MRSDMKQVRIVTVVMSVSIMMREFAACTTQALSRSAYNPGAVDKTFFQRRHLSKSDDRAPRIVQGPVYHLSAT